VRDLVLRALAKNPADRFASAAEMARAAMAAADTADVPLAGPISAVLPLPHRARSRRRVWPLATVAAGTLLALAATTLVVIRTAESAPGHDTHPGANPTGILGTAPPTSTASPQTVATGSPSLSPSPSARPSPSSHPPTTAPTVAGPANKATKTTTTTTPPSTTPALILVPNLIGDNVSFAETQLQDRGLQFELDYVLVNSTCEVTAQSPQAPSEVTQGTIVYLTVDADSSGLCTNEPLPP
jgi:serine/threonine-protein kinase